MATACELSGSPLPKDLDSISFLPTLKGQTDKQAKHEFLYWEFYERTFRQAVIVENWKLIRSNMDNERIELYDLSQDIHEDENLAKKTGTRQEVCGHDGKSPRLAPKLANSRSEQEIGNDLSGKSTRRELKQTDAKIRSKTS